MANKTTVEELLIEEILFRAEPNLRDVCSEESFVERKCPNSTGKRECCLGIGLRKATTCTRCWKTWAKQELLERAK